MPDLLGLAGLFVAILGALAGAFGFLWSHVKDVDGRLRRLEVDFALLGPFVEATKRKLQEDAERSVRRRQ